MNVSNCPNIIYNKYFGIDIKKFVVFSRRDSTSGLLKVVDNDEVISIKMFPVLSQLNSMNFANIITNLL